MKKMIFLLTKLNFLLLSVTSNILIIFQEAYFNLIIFKSNPLKTNLKFLDLDLLSGCLKIQCDFLS